MRVEAQQADKKADKKVEKNSSEDQDEEDVRAALLAGARRRTRRQSSLVHEGLKLHVRKKTPDVPELHVGGRAADSRGLVKTRAGAQR